MSNLLRVVKQRGLTQRAAAARCGVSHNAFNIVCKNGVKNVATAKRYAEMLHCDWREIMG